LRHLNHDLLLVVLLHAQLKGSLLRHRLRQPLSSNVQAANFRVRRVPRWSQAQSPHCLFYPQVLARKFWTDPIRQI
jgi:hypothetical protein